jgi:hypothetical protein
VNLLRNNGHTVTRILTQSPTAAYTANLNTFDLVISSRQVNSGDYQDDPERALWHGITKPMMFMSAYVLRNNRLQFFTADDVPDISNQGPVTLTAAVPSHPIFQGVTLDGSNNMQYATYPVTTPSGLAQRGISVSNNPIVAGATVLATSGTAGSGMNGTLIGHWPTGTQVGAYTLAGPRLSFLSGSRESDPPAQVPLAGIKDLTTAGDQLFLNAVCFMATCGPPLVPGDTNGNGVGGEFPADFDPIRNNFQKNVTSRAQGDLVLNGIVDFDDFRQWKAAHLGMGGSLDGLDLSFAANIPEPTTLGLAIFAMGGVAAQARRTRVRASRL